MAEGGVGLSELLTKEDFLFHYENLLLAKGRRKTYLCYELKGKKPVVLRNKPKSGDKLEGTHVEKLFVKALDPKFNGQVTCYLSWSPCAKCSKTLVQFVKQNTKVKLRILASRLYLYEEEDIREGLRSLHAAGVSIDIMAEKDFEDCWKLFVDSNKPFPPWEKLKENSDYFIGELQDILQEADIVAGMKKLTTRDDGPTQ